MSDGWPPLAYGSWSATCDTLHAHAQVLGKLAVQLAPPEPQLQHAALRLSARGWETLPLPAPDGSGAIVAALDLQTHEAVVEHSGGHETQDRAHPQPAGGGGDARGARGASSALGVPSRSIRPPRRCRGRLRSTRTASTRPMTPTR